MMKSKLSSKAFFFDLKVRVINDTRTQNIQEHDKAFGKSTLICTEAAMHVAVYHIRKFSSKGDQCYLWKRSVTTDEQTYVKLPLSRYVLIKWEFYIRLLISRYTF
jgi:hypothetical protein